MLFFLNTKEYKLKNQTTFVEDNVFIEPKGSTSKIKR